MRSYHLVVGSVPYFEEELRGMRICGDDLMEKVEEFDRSRYGGSYDHSNCLVVRNNHLHALTEQAHSRLGGLIEDLTTDEAEIVIHNPTAALVRYLEMQHGIGAIELDRSNEERSRIAAIENMEAKVDQVKKGIVGQDAAVESLAKSLWYLSKTDRPRPFVMMLYGKSSLGKTETARALADVFFDGEMIEKHLSMFETTAYADYLFGGKPNVRSLGYELNERMSNLVFLDEIDKCNPVFHSAFYSLLDSDRYIDSTYEVDIAGLVVLLTCNYLTLDDIRSNLGDPIYYRIDKFVPYVDFTPQAIYEITKLEISRQLAQTNAELSFDDVYQVAATRIGLSGENGRTIKSAVRYAIEDLVYPGGQVG